jgi:hypothetical protein
MQSRRSGPWTKTELLKKGLSSSDILSNTLEDH